MPFRRTFFAVSTKDFNSSPRYFALTSEVKGIRRIICRVLRVGVDAGQLARPTFHIFWSSLHIFLSS